MRRRLPRSFNVPVHHGSASVGFQGAGLDLFERPALGPGADPVGGRTGFGAGDGAICPNPGCEGAAGLLKIF